MYVCKYGLKAWKILSSSSIEEEKFHDWKMRGWEIKSRQKQKRERKERLKKKNKDRTQHKIEKVLQPTFQKKKKEEVEGQARRSSNGDAT